MVVYIRWSAFIFSLFFNMLFSHLYQSRERGQTLILFSLTPSSSLIYVPCKFYIDIFSDLRCAQSGPCIALDIYVLPDARTLIVVGLRRLPRSYRKSRGST